MQNQASLLLSFASSEPIKMKYPEFARNKKSKLMINTLMGKQIISLPY